MALASHDFSTDTSGLRAGRCSSGSNGVTFLGGDCVRGESAGGGSRESSGGDEGVGASVPGTSGSEYCGTAPAEGPDGLKNLTLSTLINNKKR